MTSPIKNHHRLSEEENNIFTLQASVVCLCFYFTLLLFCISSMLFLLGFRRDLDFASVPPSHIRFKVDSVGFKGWTEEFSHFLCSMPLCFLLSFRVFFLFFLSSFALFTLKWASRDHYAFVNISTLLLFNILHTSCRQLNRNGFTISENKTTDLAYTRQPQRPNKETIK